MSHRLFSLPAALLVVLIVGTRVVSAQVCTHHANASDGDDLNAGTLTAPVRSLTHAFRTFPTGAVVCVAAGEYFQGEDAEGVRLDAVDRSMTFVLNAFAGSQEVRISEKRFVVDAGSGTVAFRPGTASRLVIGTGVSNRDATAAPANLNFVHSLRLVSGALDVTGVDVQVGPSVGAPGWANPDNPAKTAPADAEILFGDVRLTGTLSIPPATRQYRLSPTTTGASFPLPGALGSSTVRIEGAGEVSISVPVSLEGGSLHISGSPAVRFGQTVSLVGGSLNVTGSPTVTFDRSVTLTSASLVHSGSRAVTFGQDLIMGGGSLVASGTGTTRFIGTANLTGTQLRFEGGSTVASTGRFMLNDPAGALAIATSGPVSFDGLLGVSSPGLPQALVHTGTGSVRIADLVLTRTGSASGPSATAVVHDGPGSLAIARVDAPVSPTGGRFAPVLANTGGSLVLGAPAADLALPGRIENAGAITLAGNVTLRGSAESAGIPILQGIGRLDLGPFVLALAAEGGTYGCGAAVDATTGRLEVRAPTTLRGGCSLPELRIDSATESDSRVFRGGVRVSSAASLRLVAAGDHTVASSLQTESGARLVLDAASSLAVGRDLLLDGPFAWPTGLSLGLDAGAEHVVRSAEPLPSTHLKGSSVVLDGPIRVSGDLIQESDLLVLSATSATVRIDGRLDARDGLLRIANGQEVRAARVEINGGRVEIGGTLESEGALLVQSGSLVAGDAAELRFGSDFLAVGTAELNGADLVATGSGEHHVDLGREQTVGTLSALRDVATVIVASDLRFPGPFVWSRGSLRLDAPSVLRLEDDLTILGGRLDPEGLGRVSFVGQSPSTVTTPADAVLPNLGIVSGTVRFATSLVVAGSLTVSDARVSIGPGVSVRVRSITALESGELIVASGSTLWLEGGGTLSGGMLRGEPTSTVRVSGPLVSTGATVRLESSRLVLSGGSTLDWSVSGLTRIRSLHVMEAGTEPQTASGSSWAVSDTLVVESGAVFAAGLTALVMDAPDDRGSVRIDGAMSGTLFLDGRSRPASVFRIGGSGVFGGIDIQLAADNHQVEVDPSTLVLRLGGLLRLRRGILALGAARIRPEPGKTAGLWLNFADTAAPNGRPDGASFGLPAGVSPITAGTDPYDLRYEGAISSFFRPGPEFDPTRVRDLWIDMPDEVNQPSVFGFDLVSAVDVRGTLTIEPRTRLRLVRPLTLSGSDRGHRIDGRIDGAAVRVTGSGRLESLVDVGSAVRLARLEMAGTRVDLGGLGRLGTLSILGGTVVWTATGSQSVTDSLLIAAGTLRLLTDVQVGTGTGGRIGLTGGRLEIGSSRVLTAGPGVSLDGASSAVVAVSREASGIQAGYVSMAGEGTIRFRTPLPRLRLAASVAGADDVYLEAPLVVSEEMDLLDGDLILGVHDLELRGGAIHVDRNGTPLDGSADGLVGDVSTALGRVLLTGPVDVFLGNDLEITSASVVMRAGPVSSVRVRSLSSQPRRVLLDSRPFLMESGTLDLGLNDLQLNGSTEGIFSYAGGRFLAQGSPSPAPGSGSGAGSGDLFPFRDAEYGELVLGSGSASIQLMASVEIPNVRLRGNLRFPDGAMTLTVADRFAFGRGGASLNTAASGQLLLSDGCVLVRQGRGAIGNDPTFFGTVDLFYDLDDGDLSGTASGFTEGTLAMGAEVPRDPGGIRHLGILAGDAAGRANTVTPVTGVQVNGALALYSGIFGMGSLPLTIVGDGPVAFEFLDPDVPGELRSTRQAAYETSGPIDLFISSPYRDLTISETLIPGGTSIDSLSIGVGSPAFPRDLSIVMNTSRISRTASFTGARPSDALVLAGRDLTTTGAFRVPRGTVTSGPVATIQSGGTVDLGAEGTVRGAVALVASGDVRIDGRFAGLLLQASGDLTVNGSIPTGSLILTGSDQRLSLARDEAVISLTLSQVQGSDPVSRVRLESLTAEPVALSVTSSLTLDHGLLITGQNSLVLPGFTGAVTRMDSPGTRSHIVGRVVRTLPTSARGTYLFPTGGELAYRPLLLTLDEPLLSASTLSVRHVDQAPAGELGLPLTTSDAVTLRGIAGYSWSIGSSVNFARSQPYSLTVRTPGMDASDASAWRLIERSDGISTPWSLRAEPTVRTTHTDGSTVLTWSGTRGGLLPSGTVLSIASPVEAAGSLAYLQVVRPPSERTERVDLSFDGASFAPSFESGRVTPAIPIRVRIGDSAPRSLQATIRDASGIVLQTDRADLTLQPGRLSVAAVVPLQTGGSRLAVLPGTVPTAASAGLTHAVIVQGADFPTPLTVFESAPQPSFLAPALSPGTVYSPGPVRAGVMDVAARPTTGGRAAGTFRFDFGTSAGAPVLIELSGTPFAAGSLPFSMRAVLQDGTVVPGEWMVAAEPPPTTDANPIRFALRGNYPNPFNPETTIVFDLPEPADVRLEVFDLLGRRVRELDAGLIDAGTDRTVRFVGHDLATGAYLYRLTAKAGRSTQTVTGRFVLLR